jgi:hypothetical protein
VAATRRQRPAAGRYCSATENLIQLPGDRLTGDFQR